MEIGSEAQDGWAGLQQYMSSEDVEKLKKETKQKEAEKARIASAYHALFSTPLGQTVLNDMRNHTIEISSLPQSAVDGMSIALEMARREGENEHYRRTVRLIRKGEQINHAATQPTAE